MGNFIRCALFLIACAEHTVPVLASSTEDCSQVYHQVYKRDALHTAKRMRKEWMQILPFFIDITQKEYVNPVFGKDEDREHEYPLTNERFNLLGPVLDACKTPLDVFGGGDEEKHACGLRQLATVTSECVVFSIGSNNVWGFEEEIYKSTSCRIETFDCTVRKNAKVPDVIKDRTRLHRVCLGDKDELRGGKQFSTWDSLLTLVGITTAPTFLKMDIEGYEFEVMRSIIESGKNLPLQIAMELHYYASVPAIFKTGRKSSAEIFAFMNYLQLFGGYYLIDRRDGCPECSEILLAKLDCNQALLTQRFDTLKNQTNAAFGTALKKVLSY